MQAYISRSISIKWLYHSAKKSKKFINFAQAEIISAALTLPENSMNLFVRQISHIKIVLTILTCKQNQLNHLRQNYVVIN